MDALRICSWLWILVGLVWLVFAMRKKETQERAGFGLRLAYGLPVIAAFYLLFSSRIPFAWLERRLVSPNALLDALGVALTAAGVALAIWARWYIGENWSSIVSVKVNHELICTGPYAWVRHPIYSGLLLAATGTSLVRVGVCGLVALPILWFGFWIKSRVEEQFMLKTFGQAYAEYSRSTGALIPKFHW
jgi:protein-S-isoprenylcysteine O-methyltransferase Ste14